MDRFYHGIETSLLALSLLLGLGAFTLSAGPFAGLAGTRGEGTAIGATLAVTLPMLTVTADR